MLLHSFLLLSSIPLQEQATAYLAVLLLVGAWAVSSFELL